MEKLNFLLRNIYRGDNLVKITELRYLPRWVIILFDVLICIAAFFISYLIVERLNVKPPAILELAQEYLFVIAVNLIFMFVFRTFAGIIRHSTFLDLLKILLAQICTFMVLLFVNYGSLAIQKHKLFLTPLLLLYVLVSVSFLFVFRMVVKQMFQFFLFYRKSSSKKRLLVLGIDDASVGVARAVISDPASNYVVEGFITKRSDSRRAALLGKKIYSQKSLIQKKRIVTLIDGILMVKNNISLTEMQEWTNLALENDLRIFKAPSVDEMSEQNISNKIRALQIEDLLNREPISLDNQEVKSRHFNRNVLVTGGAGSIGSEIVRQVALFNPSLLVVLDQAETPLYEVELEMREKYPSVNFRFVLADVSNLRRIEEVFDEFNFSMVYHAAAYKHVPLIEENPHEAILVNVLGSKNLALLASKYKVNRFVMVSTDKAVNPTNVMGASKRVAELYVQSLNDKKDNSTKFITTRFGNVLGSNGSVIPHFKKQIEKGGPVTITHPDIVRYFMTIPEACDLVLQAGTMGAGGEIFVFDMGQPVKIVDLAKRMIKLYGLRPEEDVQIVYTGLRPGEKLYEELLSDGVKTMPTHHEKIMISKDLGVPYEIINSKTANIIRAALKRDKMNVVELLKEIVPEFKSNNSEFEVLDH